MATAEEEEVTDILWEEMKTFAEEQQQYLYELLGEWTKYESHEHKFLKQNIGYAIYGSPQSTKDESATKDNSCYYETNNLNNTDAADIVGYNDDAKKIINNIYDKLCLKKTEDAQSIDFSIIYNMIFRPRAKQKVKSTKKKEKEVKKEIETEVKEENKLFVVSQPIFKVRKSVKKESEATKKAKEEDSSTAVEIHYESWYIDIAGRVYKNWTDYLENNNLPQCTMVFPKDGVYQPNLDYLPTEDYSTVWLEIKESPACAWRVKLCHGIDIATSVVGIGTAGLSVVAMFTPLAPVVIASSLAVTGMTGAWSLGRNSRQLVDRSSHEESIHILNKEAFSHYLGIAGTAVGLGTIGGSAIISNVAARGMAINTATRVAFNTLQGSSLVLNGVGIAYQGYCMIDKYQTDKSFSIGDALNLATHIMFFCGSVVQVQFANDIIESTQGRVIDDYKQTLSSRRLRKKYNRVAQNAAESNISKMSENAEVIRYIRNRQDLRLLSNQSATNGSNWKSNKPPKFVLSWESGRLKVNGVTLLDPIAYVTQLVKLGIFMRVDQNNSSEPQYHANDSTAEQLTKLLCDLLSKLYVSDDCPKSSKIPIVPDFEPLIREMSSMNITEDYLRMLFKIAEKLLKRSKNMDDFLLLIFTFVWQYCKANLKEWGMSFCYCTQSISTKNVLQRIIRAVFEGIDMMLNNLHSAFIMFIESYLKDK